MIGHRTRFPKKDDLPLCRRPAIKNKPSFFFCARDDLAWNYVQHCQNKTSSVVQIKVLVTISWNYVVVEVFIKKSVKT